MVSIKKKKNRWMEPAIESHIASSNTIFGKQGFATEKIVNQGEYHEKFYERTEVPADAPYQLESNHLGIKTAVETLIPDTAASLFGRTRFLRPRGRVQLPQ